MTEEQSATELDRTGLEDSHGVRRSALERNFPEASRLPSHPAGAPGCPPAHHASMFSPWKMRYSRMLEVRLEVTQAGGAAVLASRESSHPVPDTVKRAGSVASTGHHRARAQDILPRQLGRQPQLPHPVLPRQWDLIRSPSSSLSPRYAADEARTQAPHKRARELQFFFSLPVRRAHISISMPRACAGWHPVTRRRVARRARGFPLEGTPVWFEVIAAHARAAGFQFLSCCDPMPVARAFTFRSR
jgi:hypothetical protein